MNIKTLMFLKKASGGSGEQNLLDYTDLVNKTYGGDTNMNNVRPNNKIAVEPGTSLVLTGPQVSEVDIRFYDENATYQSSKTIEVYKSGTVEINFTVPEGMYYMLPKWYLSTGELPVETFIQSNPVIKYA